MGKNSGGQYTWLMETKCRSLKYNLVEEKKNKIINKE